VGDFVAVVYDAKWFIGKIEEIDREENDCEGHVWAKLCHSI
jgi:hypothetical protein